MCCCGAVCTSTCERFTNLQPVTNPRGLWLNAQVPTSLPGNLQINLSVRPASGPRVCMTCSPLPGRLGVIIPAWSLRGPFVALSVCVCGLSVCLSPPLWFPAWKRRSTGLDLTFHRLPGHFVSESGPGPSSSRGLQEGSVPPTALQRRRPAALGWQL